MDNLTTTTQVDPAVSTFYDRVLLKRATPLLVHDKWGQVRSIPQKSGNTIKFRRYASLSVATTPLAEGITPPGKQLSKTDLTAKVSFYGDFVHIADIVDLTVEDAVLTEAAEILGEQMGETLDELTRDILAACASSTNASGGSNGETPTEISKADIDSVVQTLINNKAKFISSMIKAGTGQGTTPVRRAFWGVIHSELLSDLEDVSGFKAVESYPKQSDVQEEEWGSTGNVRWVFTQKGYKDTSQSPDEWHLPIFGRDAYGIINIRGATAKNIVKGFGSGGTSDPLNQRATSGWKTGHTCRILNDNFMHLLKVTDSDSTDT